MRSQVGFLLARRRKAIILIQAIDSELEKLGVRAAEKAPGRGRWMANRVVEILASGPLDARTIISETGQRIAAGHQMLSKMVLAGELVRVGRGVYGLPGTRRAS
jgi:predicted Rossmann fold nucleotide-binding protein DprA/Smf involved in DNA uptake